MLVDIPEPFKSALREGSLVDAAKDNASTPEALFGRGLVRVRAGSDHDARVDFEAAATHYPDLCGIQIGHIDLRANQNIDKTAEDAQRIAEATEVEEIACQAWHLAGLAKAKVRDSESAIAALLKARELSRRCSRPDLQAQIEDTLGSVYVAIGELNIATSHFVLSLLDKTQIGDQYGIGITLGNLGRAHLRAGRIDDAMEFFRRDLKSSRKLGDRRGEGVATNSLGRCLLALGEISSARTEFMKSLETARQDKRRYLEFYNLKDLAQAALMSQDLEGAADFIKAAEALLTDRSPQHLKAHVAGVEGRLLVERSNEKGLDILKEVARIFADADLPDFEISALIALAEAQLKFRWVRSAEKSLTRALDIARSRNFSRYLPVIGETMTRLRLVEGVAEESDRSVVKERDVADPNGYVLLESLGRGGFGEVFRAFDGLRNRVVAFKRLQLGKLYDIHRRERLIATARREIETASRIRHPGVARVYAIGVEPDGNIYIAQELVDGRSLRESMRPDATENLVLIVETVELVAMALEALHVNKVVHRDLKPENIIMRSRDQTPVLVDFGIARLPDSEDCLEQGGIVGTLEYMSREQILGEAIDGRADVYSLGVLAFEWLTGHRPLKSGEGPLGRVLNNLLGARAPSLNDERPDLPKQLVDLVDQMLLDNREKRPSASDVAARCRSILDHIDATEQRDQSREKYYSTESVEARFEQSREETIRLENKEGRN